MNKFLGEISSIFLFSLLFSLILVPTSQVKAGGSSILVVDDDGYVDVFPPQSNADCDGVGIPTQVYFDINSAIAEADPGDTIIVCPGTYQEKIILDEPIMLEGIDKPLIRGSPAITLNADNSGLSGFEVDSDGLTHCITVNSESSHINGNFVKDCGFIGIQINGDNNQIHGNKINNPRSDGITLNGENNSILGNNITKAGEGIKVNGDFNQIQGNKIIENRNDGIDVKSDFNLIQSNQVIGNGDDGIELKRANENDVNNNSCSENSDNGIFVNSGSNNVIAHNRCNNNGLDGIVIWTDDTTVVYNELDLNDDFGINSPIENIFEMNRCSGNSKGDSNPDGLCQNN